jgi:hypothetical protein
MKRKGFILFEYYNGKVSSHDYCPNMKELWIQYDNVIDDIWDMKGRNKIHFFYSFPVMVRNKNVGTITLVSLYGGNLNSQKPDLMQKYFGHEEYEKSWWTFSHDTYLDCYLTIHKKFTLPQIVKGLRGNEFRFRITYGYPENESESEIWGQYVSGECYRYDNDLNIQILDKIQIGWSLGEKINENINKRILNR